MYYDEILHTLNLRENIIRTMNNNKRTIVPSMPPCIKMSAYFGGIVEMASLEIKIRAKSKWLK